MTASDGGRGRLAPMLTGRPAAELTDAELEAQGTRAHETRNWVFLHGTAEQFARHTSRMLELEQEYLRRHPQRTWQGSGGAATDARGEAAALRTALRGIVAQLDALASESAGPAAGADGGRDPVLDVLGAVAAAPGGRLHKLAVHQAARVAGLDRTALAGLYHGDAPALATDGEDRAITEAGRDRLRAAGRRSRPRADGVPELGWVRRDRPVADHDVARIVGAAPRGVFDVAVESGNPLPGEWWAATEPDGHVVGFGWMDVGWGEAEILLAVEPDGQGGGAGSFIIGRLEAEAAARGLNYVYNTVRPDHPRRDELADWLAARGYTGDVDTGPLRKRVTGEGAPSVGALDLPSPGAVASAAPAASPPEPAVEPSSGSVRGPGAEEAGGYVDIEDHQY